MADHSSIEWTDATWNPITGCSIVSPGCTNCYAMKLAGTRLKHIPSREGLTRDASKAKGGEAAGRTGKQKSNPVWTGEVRLNEQWLDQPLRWKRPRRIFVCAHGDLFAENVPDAWIDRVFAVMAEQPRHTFQVLTKRAGRLRAELSASDVQDRIGEVQRREHADICAYTNVGIDAIWPLPNVWLGVSAEDQRRADERVPELLATPAAVRFVSAEPLLGPIDFTELRTFPREGVVRIHRPFAGYWGDARDIGNRRYLNLPPRERMTGRSGVLDWIIVGGESGADARPMHPDWARSIRDQCTFAGVDFFFKQWGSWGPDDGPPPAGPDRIMQGKVRCAVPTGDTWTYFVHGYAPPLDPDTGQAEWLYALGKKAAGRLLDGIEHNAFPTTRT